MFRNPRTTASSAGAGSPLPRRRFTLSRRRRALAFTAAAAAGLMLFAGVPASSAPQPIAPGEDPAHNVSVVAQAQPDECWVGFGKEPLPIGPNGTCAKGQARTNEQYIWGVTADSKQKNIWFGTSTNVMCNGVGTVAPLFESAGLNQPVKPYNDPANNTCEFDKSRKFLGEKRFTEYNNIKNFFTTRGQMYVGTALAKPVGSGSQVKTGAVLKWAGDLKDPLRFETVGLTQNQGAYFADYEGRLVTSTWTGGSSGLDAGLEISPPLHGKAGLTSDDRYKWTSEFNLGEILPNPVTSSESNMFKCVPFKGWLYCGAGIPTVAPSLLAHLTRYPDIPRSSVKDIADAYLKSSPGSLVFRTKNLGKRSQTTELLYGEKKYWDYQQGTGWQLKNNGLHQTPKFGTSGFGNRWNDYAAWGADVFRGKLYMGEFNTTQIIRRYTLNPASKVMETVLGRPVSAAELKAIRDTAFPDDTISGQVWYFDNEKSAAKPLTKTGFNNADNFGVRGFIPVGDKYMFMSTNGAWQYPAGGTTGPLQRPGWQLLKMTP